MEKKGWCLWLVGIQPHELRGLPEILKRVEKVKLMRLASKKIPTVKCTETPILFGENRQPLKGSYILVPCYSSGRREYIPMGFVDVETISNNKNLMIPNGGLYEFGILESKIHMVWMSTICGRLKSDYNYSAKLVYNNFPWTESNENQKQAIEKAAQQILDARKQYPDSTLADLYDPIAMPANLRKAHTELDKLVEKSYRKTPFKDDAERIQFLFERYQLLIDAEGA